MRDLARLPKAHLHVHLESTVRWATLREIGDANGVAVPERTSTHFTGFREFADHNMLVRSCLRRAEDFRRIAREFCEDEASQGTRYAEVTFTAASHGERLGNLDMPLDAVLDGLKEGQAAHDIECRVILDHSRRRSVDRARRTLDLATRFAEQGVVALGLAGEESYSLTPFVDILSEAKDSGMNLVHHAGECCGPASVREALAAGRADRLGHGIRVLEDDDVVAEVRDSGIALEVCPSSNVTLGLVGSLSEHPFPLLQEAGLVVTINTDIPSIIGTTLTEEYGRIRDAFGYDDILLAELARASIDASFAPAATKTRLHRQTDAWLAVPTG